MQACKFKSHHKNEYWFLLPHLQPSGQRHKGGRQGERQGGNHLRIGFSVEGEEEGSYRGENNLVIKEHTFSPPDQMQHLMEHLSLLLSEKNELKNSGITLTHLTCKNKNTD
jgi:hypothetical protein